MERIRILVVDDHPIVRQGITSLLSNYPEFEIVDEADCGAAAIRVAESHTLDVVLLDIRMPGESGLDVLRRVRSIQPEAQVLMLTSFDDDEYVVGALRAGARGFVLKSVSDEMLVNAIRGVHRGERILSPQVAERVVQQLLSDEAAPAVTFDEDERQILRLLTEGASNTQIADALYISVSTAKRKLRAIFDKLDVDTRAEAAAEAVRRGVV
ncbi:MAG TPA: response regulator transcription factor [Candidatus Sulfomarinibacteraceae bacterium]|nr:response regulator transcription factor [Candidatus Sulfomarinibacteraceae bacterium]